MVIHIKHLVKGLADGKHSIYVRNDDKKKKNDDNNGDGDDDDDGIMTLMLN